jgi:glycerophosphoryl diester phosphodiesterase
MKKLLVVFLSVAAVGALAVGCTKPDRGKDLCLKAGIPYKAVIGHRGACYYAPEETTASYTLARDIGADYLEADLQLTKDGAIVCIHDSSPARTTNIAKVFPKRVKDDIRTFTLAELKQLDAGSWFNEKFPDRARASYKGLKILTLDELIDIALGGENKPGIYIETKGLNPTSGIEVKIYDTLKRRGLFNDMKAPAGFDPAKNVGVMYTKGRVVLQTFEPSSLPLLNKYMPDIPKVFLWWIYTQKEADDWGITKGIDQKDPKADLSKTYGPLAEPIDPAAFKGKSEAEGYAMYKVLSKENFKKWLEFAKKNGAIGVGPSVQIDEYRDPVKGAYSYMDLVAPWMMKMYHDEGLVIHAYTIDNEVDMKRLNASVSDPVDGIFTNRADKLLEFYGRKPSGSVDDILKKNNF